MNQTPEQLLSSNWEFRRDGDASQEEWLSVEDVPSEVHDELVRHGKISDPFIDVNELASRWVSEESWRYRTKFPTPDDARHYGGVVDLVFVGLDTFATVWLNGQNILKSDNMFIQHRVNIDQFLRRTAEDNTNVLEIVFDPARRRGLELAAAHPEHQFIVHQTEVGRGAVRKAQYNWGWDWGPVLLTCGPWKPVRLETWFARIDDIKIDYSVSLGQQVNEVEIINVSAAIFGTAAHAVADIFYKDEHVLKLDGNLGFDIASNSRRYASKGARVDRPHLWWPRGYGDQSLYRVRLQALASDGSTVLATAYQTVGFRKVELIQEKDEFGKSFYFRINNIDMFSGGSCWIPADSIVSRISPERYRSWIELLVKGNQNMVRIWGGGIYEANVFYDACDELGVMVWQDFMFACASYPTYPEFLASVEVEARQAIGRLRSHPSVIVWCGNNEDYQLIERYGLEYNFDEDKDPDSWLKSTFPARYIYEHLLPKVVDEEAPGAVYHPGSPWGNGVSTTLAVDATVGDIHQWNMWHGDMKPYQKLPDMGGRFVSEFGMEAYPHLETMHKFVSKPSERYPGSTTMDFHNKAVGHERRLLTYVGENFRLKTDLGSFAHLTQVMQADAVSWAFKSWRRHWGTAGSRRCGGALVWQLNDCWPTVSWAVVDYFLVKKPAYYAIRRAMAPVAVAVTRKFHDWTTRPADGLWKRDTGHVDPTEALTHVSFDVWVASSRLEALRGHIVVRFISIRTGKETKERIERDVAIQPNACTEVVAEYEVAADTAKGESEHFIIQASLEVDGATVSSDISWPDPIKYLDFSDRMVQVTRISQSLVEVSAEKPVKGFVFSERQGVEVSDNGFDLVPGEPRQVSIEGIDAGGELPWTYVGS